ncbi:hypothetical protein [Streptomyces hirsutus]|uniref:hypothetical protein n=1 Tax=Streptomyces hirsutus TaxID=35620 RepID=UPI00365C45A9
MYTVGRGADKEERRRPLRAPQLLVPNSDGIACIRLLGRLTRLTRLRSVEDPYAVDPSVPLLGKWLTWFADWTEFPDGWRAHQVVMEHLDRSEHKVHF